MKFYQLALFARLRIKRIKDSFYLLSSLILAKNEKWNTFYAFFSCKICRNRR